MKERIDKESREIVLPYWLPERFIVVDLVTTGLCPVTNEIIEIAATKFCSDETTHVTFQCLAPRLDLSFTKLTPSDRLPFDYPKLEFEGKHFSFVGKFFSGSKIFFYQLVVRKNGIPGNFSKKTDYLVVGADVGADWIVSAAGRRILNVLNMKEAGSPIQIINEYQLHAHV
ncbi:MAG: hypothetical protein Q7L07_13610 [Pseudohongiella sp.]|nr:hypothetical protein [Pseudohongiella sp.]